MDVTIESPDFEKLERTFNELEYADQRKIGMAALRKGTEPTIIQAQANIFHDVTGHLRRSVGAIHMYPEIAVVIGARKTKGYKGFHGHLVEEGTVNRWAETWRKRPLNKKRFTGKMNASKPYAFWLRKAVQSTEQTALNITSNEIYKSITDIHAKNGLK